MHAKGSKVACCVVTSVRVFHDSYQILIKRHRRAIIPLGILFEDERRGLCHGLAWSGICANSSHVALVWHFALTISVEDVDHMGVDTLTE